MINIYPANRLENLVILLDRVMQTGNNVNVLSEEVILVQSKGMQHWLNLKLAESRGISMNLSFSLPMQFFWNQIRNLLGKDRVPEQSTYIREVLSWRIDAILATDEVVNNPLCQEATHYWLGSEDKRFQLACQLADLFEQYQIFRPDWILKWEKGQSAGIPGENWQALIWQLLVAQEPLHPVRLLKQAINALSQHKCTLPERISLFGINTLPPLWLEFLTEVGKQTQVHFFHLNPCVEYWGDLKTDKAYAREQLLLSSLNRWLETEQPISNPLLSNLGTQGKDFLYLLQEHTSIEIPVYESPEELSEGQGEITTVLQKIQSDILNLHDAREIDRKTDHKKQEPLIDDSIIIASAHSALREIQALHDWLLHQVNTNTNNGLTPKDILVMCPNIENYAPYIEAVFAHGWNDLKEQVPPLPCSIADRTLKDSEPLVQAFIDVLELPDSRFQISQILAYLRLPALQQKFGFSDDDRVSMERWINHAAIHWGLDETHKRNILSVARSNNKFTWQQGLERLLLGFAQGDKASLYQAQLLLPDVEGDESIVLGRLFELLEQLQFYARELLTPRSPVEWKHFLQQAKDNLFDSLSEDSNAQQIIEQAIDDLGEYTAHAQYEQAITLTVVRDFLLNHFNQPEPGRQFMAGQVTFCSMIPMRSVPFKVIAILGLNDGEFPRQRQPMGFDLMATEPPRKGDRSRRGDDRYLFLEALISCRNKLYLSYQGHDIKNNNIREPSLVLQELIDYLEKGFGWHIFKDNQTQLYKVPLQAFSKDNYRGMKSFNAQWLKLSEAGEYRQNLHSLPALSLSETDDRVISAEQLVQFFDNPCKSFAQERLNLYFEATEEQTPQDSEPFVSDHLDRYLIQDAILKTLLDKDSGEQEIDDLMQGFRLGGTLPDTPNTEKDLLQWLDQASEFSNHIQKLIQNQEPQQIKTKTVKLIIDGIQLEAELPYLGNNLFFWRLAMPKGKDDIRLWIHHLIAQIANETNHPDSIETRGVFRGKNDSIMSVFFNSVQFLEKKTAREHLTQLIRCWKEGMQQPLLLHALLGQKHCQGKKSNKAIDDTGFCSVWNDDYQTQGLGSDPYVNWFWSGEKPQWQGDWRERIEQIYEPIYEYRQEEQIE